MFWFVQCPDDMVGFMANVVLPSSNEEAIKYAQVAADKEHNVYFVYSKFQNKDAQETVYFVRISAQVYVSFDNFCTLAALVPKLLRDFEANQQQN